MNAARGSTATRESGWGLGRLTTSRASFDGWSAIPPAPVSQAAAAGSAKVVAPVAGLFDGWSGSAPGPASCPLMAAAGSAKVVAPVAGSNQKRLPSGVADLTHVPVAAATPPPPVPGDPGDGWGGSIGSGPSKTKLMSPIRSIAKLEKMGNRHMNVLTER